MTQEELKQLKELNEQGYTQMEMAKIMGKNRTTIQRNLHKMDLHTPNYHNAIKFNNTVFDKIDTEEKAYWLGFLYADGAISLNKNNVELSLQEADKDHLVKFKNFLQTPKEVKTSISHCNNKQYQRCRLAVTDKHFKEQLIKLGCGPQKSLTLTFPDVQIFTDPTLINSFVRGYFEGDGCLSYTPTGRAAISIVGTYEFLTGLLNHYSSFTKIRKDNRHKNNTFYVNTACNPADTFLKTIYQNATIFLDRKYDRFCRLVK